MYIIEENYQVFLQLQYYYVQVRYNFGYSELVISTSNFSCTSQCLLKRGKEELTTLSFEIGDGCQSRICACRSSNFAFISGDAPTYPISLMPLLHITPSERYKYGTPHWPRYSTRIVLSPEFEFRSNCRPCTHSGRIAQGPRRCKINYL